jgi:hypothetical protein
VVALDVPGPSPARPFVSAHGWLGACGSLLEYKSIAAHHSESHFTDNSSHLYSKTLHANIFVSMELHTPKEGVLRLHHTCRTNGVTQHGPLLQGIPCLAHRSTPVLLLRTSI